MYAFFISMPFFSEYVCVATFVPPQVGERARRACGPLIPSTRRGPASAWRCVVPGSPAPAAFLRKVPTAGDRHAADVLGHRLPDAEHVKSLADKLKIRAP